MLSFDCRVSRITQSLKIHSTRHQMGDHQWIGYLWGGCCYKPLMSCWVKAGQFIFLVLLFIVFLWPLF